MSEFKVQNQNLKSNNLKNRSYRYSLETIKFINKLPNKRAFWSIGDQPLRSSTSIGANITEAKASSSKREFIKYYEIALKSANETEYWLNLIKDSYYVLKSDCEKLLLELEQIERMLGSSIITMKGKRSY
jgi:four helix bundle protein